MLVEIGYSYNNLRVPTDILVLPGLPNTLALSRPDPCWQALARCGFCIALRVYIIVWRASGQPRKPTTSFP